MAQRRPRDQRVVRNRRVAIYTFLLIQIGRAHV